MLLRVEVPPRLNGRLSKIALFCDFACFFGIFLILNGVGFAQIKEINAQYYLKKSKFRPFFTFFCFKYTCFSPNC